eukprot:TRINITY_DN75644_c0_g1_i1.p1 TRINITY_DN75644_c0_g1~~TRINITY_DN75644_c0_g1_i1.p1  ORF type:complete len:286 (-),score=46.19 TRINITY_DN75644_c0_g1_i1:195-1052(-)
MPKINKFHAEYAKSNMATCRVCMAKIPKEALRIGHVQEDVPLLPNDAAVASERAVEKEVKADKRQFAIAQAARWHHFECFPKMKGPKWMAANLPAKPESAVFGFKLLKKQDQQRVLKLFKALHDVSTANVGSGRKRKLSSDATGSMAAKEIGARSKAGISTPNASKVARTLTQLTSVQGVLKVGDFKKVQKIEQQIAANSISQLQSELGKNDQVKTGKKDELIQRVAEGRVLGALPACPRCQKGRVHWSRVGGWYSCPGHFDREAKIQKRCGYRSKEAKRAKWKH